MGVNTAMLRNFLRLMFERAKARNSRDKSESTMSQTNVMAIQQELFLVCLLRLVN